MGNQILHPYLSAKHIETVTIAVKSVKMREVPPSGTCKAFRQANFGAREHVCGLRQT